MKKQCPVPNCRTFVVHLPRHLTNVHKWKKERARTALQVFNLRKPYEFTERRRTSKQPDYHHPRQCPMEGCSAIVKRLSPHLTQFHHISKKSGMFKTLVILSKKRLRQKIQPVDDSDLEEAWSDDGSEFAGSKTGSENEKLSDVANDPRNAAVRENENEDGVYCTSEAGDIQESQQSELPTDFLQFQMWLQSADGGRKCEKSSKQHAFQVGVIFEAIDQDKRVSSLWCKKKLSQFLAVDVVRKGFMPRTIKSYLSSVRHWYAYILAEESDRITADEKQKIQLMSDRVSRWINSYRREAAAKGLEKMDADLSKLVTPDKVSLFDRSQPALMAVKCLGEMADMAPKNVSQTEYVLMRDFLLTQVIISNANRSGVLANMTVQEFLTARQIGESFVISVTSHKTAHVYGPAKIVLTQTLFGWLSIFVTHVRSQITQRFSGKGGFLFLSWTGEKLESGQITRAVQSVWKKAGLGTDISCTLMRKSAVSSLHEKCPGQKDHLADLMCHSTQTASRCYRLVRRQETSVAASRTLSSLMKGDETTVDDNGHADDADGQTAANSESPAKFICRDSSVEQTQACGSSAPSSMQAGQVNELVRSEEDSDNSIIIEPSTVSGKSCKALFSKDEAELIRQCCKEIIDSGPISHKRIAETLRNAGHASLFSKFTTEQLISRVKYERRLSRSRIPKCYI
jgi:site-specific recombinase XerD